MDSEDKFLLKELLPGVPNDVVLDEIVTKQPWTNVYSLCLSKSWQQVIQCRAVYDARVRYHSTEPLAALTSLVGGSEQLEEISIYCPRENRLYWLPPIPGLPKHFQLIASDGKLYVLGGMGANGQRLQSMYVLDLAGQRQWEQCASMLNPKFLFACGVLGGKIYVFGGMYWRAPNFHNVRSSEVYDPKVNAWFPIKPMISGRAVVKVSCVDEELVLHGGCGENFNFASSWLVYHPLRDQWRVLEPSRMGPVDRLIERVFIWQGKFCSMGSDGILMLNTEENLWAHWCAIACDELGPTDSVRVDPYYILPVDNELFAMVFWNRTDNGTKGWCLLQSRGFATTNRAVVWSKTPHTFRIKIKLTSSMCLLRL